MTSEEQDRLLANAQVSGLAIQLSEAERAAVLRARAQNDWKPAILALLLRNGERSSPGWLAEQLAHSAAYHDRLSVEVIGTGAGAVFRGIVTPLFAAGGQVTIDIPLSYVESLRRSMGHYPHPFLEGVSVNGERR